MILAPRQTNIFVKIAFKLSFDVLPQHINLHAVPKVDRYSGRISQNRGGSIFRGRHRCLCTKWVMFFYKNTNKTPVPILFTRVVFWAASAIIPKNRHFFLNTGVSDIFSHHVSHPYHKVNSPVPMASASVLLLLRTSARARAFIAAATGSMRSVSSLCFLLSLMSP